MLSVYYVCQPMLLMSLSKVEFSCHVCLKQIVSFIYVYFLLLSESLLAHIHIILCHVFELSSQHCLYEMLF